MRISVCTHASCAHRAAIQASPIPLVRQAADWMAGNTFYSLFIASADEDSLVFAERGGQGIQWYGSALTRRPHIAPMRLARTGCTDLVPDTRYISFPQVLPVFDGEGLLRAMQVRVGDWGRMHGHKGGRGACVAT